MAEDHQSPSDRHETYVWKKILTTTTTTFGPTISTPRGEPVHPEHKELYEKNCEKWLELEEKVRLAEVAAGIRKRHENDGETSNSTGDQRGNLEKEVSRRLAELEATQNQFEQSTASSLNNILAETNKMMAKMMDLFQSSQTSNTATPQQTSSSATDANQGKDATTVVTVRNNKPGPKRGGGANRRNPM